MVGFAEESKLIGRELVFSFTVSTVITSDYGPETAIIDSNGPLVVERYFTRKLAEKGHLRWIESLRTGLAYVRDLTTDEIFKLE